MKPKLVIVLGPTAAGKSEVVVALGPQLNAEVINADSQQVYRQMDIGTAKPSSQLRDRIPHHVIDVVDPDEEFNVAKYRELATAAIHDIRQRGKQAIVCGGTGLYLKALTQGLFVGPAQSAEIRAALALQAEKSGLRALYERLERIDPAATSWIHPRDLQRIVRALEVYELTGKPMSQWQREHGFNETPFETLKIGIQRERAELYRSIDQRCDAMIAMGLVDEVRALCEKGYSLDLKPLRSVGYKQVGWFLKGQMGLEEAVVLMKRDTRRLAKRQLTWFRSDGEIHWFHPTLDRAKISDLVQEFLQ
ncbi:MAG TPA: tRNA (adenosine(37)-N6)-dimethylallyltransferase MiaA [Candidatus Binatia bacterium]|nr:tRNA (adenosine(37)-N6)-dimethylallyltransferase MiaA [Candidatus Binatia bacterium]